MAATRGGATINGGGAAVLGASSLAGARPRSSPLRSMRAEPRVVVALLAAAGLAWLSTAERMAGMDAGPGSALGSPGWFTGVWATMMAAMMLPSLAPATAAYSLSVRRALVPSLLMVGGYLLVWALAGVAAYGLFELGKSLFGGSLGWHGGAGRPLAAGVLVIAAAYQLTALKRRFLQRCRHPLGDPDPARLSVRRDAFTTGLRLGGWCLGCSWALMCALFALGIMSLTWMGLIAGLVALEKLGPSGRGARLAGAGIMIVLAVAILAVPRDVPGFVVPGGRVPHRMMGAMG